MSSHVAVVSIAKLKSLFKHPYDIPTAWTFHGAQAASLGIYLRSVLNAFKPRNFAAAVTSNNKHFNLGHWAYELVSGSEYPGADENRAMPYKRFYFRVTIREGFAYFYPVEGQGV